MPVVYTDRPIDDDEDELEDECEEDELELLMSFIKYCKD